MPFQTTAILFDLDDTLHYRYKAFANWARAFARTYYPTPDQQDTLEEMIQYLISIDDRGNTPRDEYFQRAQERYPVIKGEIANFISNYKQAVIGYVVLEDEIRVLLQALQTARIPLGIITNGASDQQRRKIDVLGFEAYTNCIFVSEEFGVRKPDPTIFLAAAKQLEIAPEKILFVGDNPECDIWGAHQVGMKTVWIEHASHHWPPEIPAGIANSTVHSFAELLPLIGISPAQEHGVLAVSDH
ncbi:HAD family hydrolase [Dictyobacter arantiisoli]|uniref:Haloacid dehalogenase n=1 Tax=Dictyobacter arantiisoli TaxID=2014874 RepID=A0A5A5TIT8_9CHLR|nr:HAD family hydrolase [Dictyobacter arantiisoli]GCF11128.1 haloacid dehalogenase [Dictyobacter arantiisoli]